MIHSFNWDTELTHHAPDFCLSLNNIAVHNVWWNSISTFWIYILNVKCFDSLLSLNIFYFNVFKLNIVHFVCVGQQECCFSSTPLRDSWGIIVLSVMLLLRTNLLRVLAMVIYVAVRLYVLNDLECFKWNRTCTIFEVNELEQGSKE